MASKWFAILTLFLAAQWRFTSSADGLAEPTSIQLSDLLSEFRRTHHDLVDIQLSFMFWVASYGDSVYRLSADLSANCSRMARVSSLMLEKFAICEEAIEESLAAVDTTTRDLKKRTQLTEHPLELLCRETEKRYVENANFSAYLEKARTDAAGFVNPNPRPPYYSEIIKKDQLMVKLFEKLDIPELAKIMAYMSFRNLLRGSPDVPRSWTLFGKCCQAVAQKAEFAESMQSLYLKAVSDILPEIMVDDRVKKYEANQESGGAWWIPSMVKALRGYITSDPVLKKEVDGMAPTIGKRERIRKADWDFSKI